MAQKSAVSVTVAQSATLLGVSETWIRKLIDEGAIPAPDDGKMPLIEVVHGYIHWLRDPARRAQRTASADRLMNLRAQEIEGRTARLEESLVPVDDVQAALTDVVDAVEAAVAKVPAKFSSDPALQEAVRAGLEAAVRTVRKKAQDCMAEITGKGAH